MYEEVYNMGKKLDTATAVMPGAGYTFTQSAMLFLAYGMDYSMPWWVRWFPTVVTGTILLVVGIVALGIIIVQAIID